MSGKGSTPRPFSVNHDTFSENWDKIFLKKKPIDDTIDVNEKEFFEQVIMKEEFYDQE